MDDTDDAQTLIDGPWRHRFVAANGARFHVVEAGQGPLVLLLHGFPQFWWVWRAQIPALVAAGHRVVAMDLRGYGASDKPPRGYDPATLCADVAGVIRSLGEEQAVVVGHDWGGWLAWSMPGLQPRVTRAVGSVSMAHPLTLRAGVLGNGPQRRAWAPVVGFQVPMLPERRLTAGPQVAELLHAWAGPAGYPDAGAVKTYELAMRVPFVAHSALEYYRWAVRSVPRQDGRRFARAVRDPLTVPLLMLHGDADPFVLPETARRSLRRADGPVSWQLIAGAGHFLPEERPDDVSAALIGWLDTLG